MKTKSEMNTTINLNKICHLPGGKTINGYCEEFATVEDAVKAAMGFLEDHPNHTCEVVRVCADLDDERYYEIVEVIKTIAPVD